jgi:adenosylcobinamide-phosphate synthase
MTLFSLAGAFLLDKLHPFDLRKYQLCWLQPYVNFFQRHLNAGELKHGKLAWSLAVLAPACGVTAIYWLLYYISPILSWIFCVLVLYAAMGFSQLYSRYSDIHQALRDSNLDGARNLLSTWLEKSCQELSYDQVARIAIEEALLATCRALGLMVWFVSAMLIGLGPAGAVFYRLAQFICVRWNGGEHSELSKFGVFARQIYYWVEWLPVRLTAMTFAVVGNFEDAVYCWRAQAQTWPNVEDGIVLASGAGAIGVRLGLPILQKNLPFDRPELGMGDVVDVDYMQSAVGLIWRAAASWMALLLLLELVYFVRF